MSFLYDWLPCKKIKNRARAIVSSTPILRDARPFNSKDFSMRGISSPCMFSPVFFRSSRNVWLVRDYAALLLSEHARLRLTEMILIRDERDTVRRKHVDVIKSNHGDRHVIIRRNANPNAFAAHLCTCSFILFRVQWPLYIFKMERKEFLQRDARAKYYTRANTSNKIVLFSSEISNISPSIFVTEYALV